LPSRTGISKKDLVAKYQAWSKKPEKTLILTRLSVIAWLERQASPTGLNAKTTGADGLRTWADLGLPMFIFLTRLPRRLDDLARRGMAPCW
jgi:hypothetical protein